ncbi:AfsR/SARP family transcriptional regulator [Nocardioides litoris]|uniref:AfsR/SARP family transcriptional regulator n=1 Tax=Nocardioides litoris TaxID=1926648 RepID=UPI0011244738|nr:BTAD domain-containing putative transcriptional regulator [Nocardioides litoris]
MSSSAPLGRLSLLGGFGLSFAEEPLSPSAAGQRLLAALALGHGRGRAPRQAVAERLWPDLPAERAAAQLRSVMWRLPRPRGRAFVVADAGSVRLGDEVDVDLWRAEEVVDRTLAGPVEPPPSADLALLALDLLPTWHDPWLAVVQESHRQRRLHALERASEALRAAGRHSEALTTALAAVLCEPLRESAHRSVIEVHLAEGNHAEALRQFHSYRRLLAAELGLPPSPAIRRLVGPLLGRPIDA